MSHAVKRVSAEISESEISGSRDFQADSALASGRASGNQLGRARFARIRGLPLPGATAESSTRGGGVPKLPLSGRDRRLGRDTLSGMSFVPPARHLLRAKDLADARYSERLDIDDLARAAGLSRAHFSREFRRAFGASPHAYLLTRRLERATALLRATDRSVAEICFSVGLQSVGSFTTSFTRTFGIPPTAYRAKFPPAADYALVPACVVRVYARPQRSTFREDNGAGRD
jgi:AraC-like DNA-binding protein